VVAGGGGNHRQAQEKHAEQNRQPIHHHCLLQKGLAYRGKHKRCGGALDDRPEARRDLSLALRVGRETISIRLRGNSGPTFWQTLQRLVSPLSTAGETSKSAAPTTRRRSTERRPAPS